MSCTILLDCDGVLANFIDKANEVLKLRLGYTLNDSDLKNWDLFKNIPNGWETFQKEVEKGDVALTMKPLPGSQDAVELLKNYGEVFVVTSPMNCKNWSYERTVWLKKYYDIKQENVVLTSAKQLVHGDILVDDNAEYIKKWKNTNSNSIECLWDAPYNANVKQFNRVYSWNDVINIVKGLKK